MNGTVIRFRRPGYTAASRRPGVPPTAAYLAERARLGILSFGAALLEHCLWCGAMPGEACHVRATGRRLSQPHHARQLLTGNPA